jgi:bifunctional non-homologous end joining protein LigD
MILCFHASAQCGSERLKSHLDERGVSQFNQLLNRRAEPVLYAFDLLWLDDEDLRRLPLVERKGRLAALVQSSRCERILYAQHVEGEGNV